MPHALDKKAPSYAYMAKKINHRYHHVSPDCLPSPADTHELEHSRDLGVEIKPLPKRLKESSLDLHKATAEHTAKALSDMRTKGHACADD